MRRLLAAVVVAGLAVIVRAIGVLDAWQMNQEEDPWQ